MRFNWKQVLGSVALSAMALSIIGTDGAVAKGKSGTIKTDPPSVDKGKSATILPEVPTVEKGKTVWAETTTLLGREPAIEMGAAA